jgi:hypothetical protein
LQVLYLPTRQKDLQMVGVLLGGQIVMEFQTDTEPIDTKLFICLLFIEFESIEENWATPEGWLSKINSISYHQ